MKQKITRRRRVDLINNMRWGQQTEIAKIVNCTPAHVSFVLNGHGNQSNELSTSIIGLAEIYARKERDRFRYAHTKEQKRKEMLIRYKDALRS